MDHKKPRRLVENQLKRRWENVQKLLSILSGESIDDQGRKYCPMADLAKFAVLTYVNIANFDGKKDYIPFEATTVPVEDVVLLVVRFIREKGHDGRRPGDQYVPIAQAIRLWADAEYGAFCADGSRDTIAGRRLNKPLTDNGEFFNCFRIGEGGQLRLDDPITPIICSMLERANTASRMPPDDQPNTTLADELATSFSDNSLAAWPRFYAIGGAPSEAQLAALEATATKEHPIIQIGLKAIGGVSGSRPFVDLKSLDGLGEIEPGISFDVPIYVVKGWDPERRTEVLRADVDSLELAGSGISEDVLIDVFSYTPYEKLAPRTEPVESREPVHGHRQQGGGQHGHGGRKPRGRRNQPQRVANGNR